MNRMPKTHLFHLWEATRTSLWFVPSLMTLAAVFLAFIMLGLDQWLALHAWSESHFLLAGPAGAREVLSTIAGSVITVTGVTFSITIVALTLASSQFGPRLLRNFMKDKGNQVVLGAFISTFIYCLIVLRAVNTEGDTGFTPELSLTLAVLLVLADVFILIYFIHHISTSIQADHVIKDVYAELEMNIGRIFQEELGQEAGAHNQPHAAQDPDPAERDAPCRREIASAATGYVQAIDYDTLLEIAREHDCLIRLRTRAGRFATAGDHIATAAGGTAFDRDFDQQVTASLIVGSVRTPEQDPEYAIRQLVEVAVRSLSPGINDPFTTIACIDRLGAALCLLANKSFPSPQRFDKEGHLKIIMDVTTFAGMTNAAFDQIRQYGRSSVSVTIRLLEALTNIAWHARLPAQRQAVVRQAEMILRASQEFLPEKNDRDDVAERHRLLLQAIAYRT